MKCLTLYLLPIFMVTFAVFSFIRPQSIKSAPSSSVKDTLSTSQLSYFARIGTSTSAGDSIIQVAITVGTAPSLTTNNLFIGDTIAIGTTGVGVGSGGPLTLYTVLDIANTQSISINNGIGQSNAFVGAAIIATRSAIHTISFTPQSNSTSGFWQFLIKASSRTGEVSNDGIPDTQGFDLGSTTPSSGANGLGTRLKATDVTCPNWGIGVTTAYSVGTTTAVVTGGSTNYYHVITCYLGVGGTNQVGVGYSMAVGADLASGSQLINPSANHSINGEGNADIYTFFVRHLDSSATLLDSDTAQGKIAVIEAVRVTTRVDPAITFTIDNTGVGVGATPCGLAAFGGNAANTTAAAVPFGSLALATNNDLAQRLSCVTNANSGYVVTVFEANPTRNVVTGTTIPDTTCPSSSCTITSPAIWNTYSTSGWGYTIHNINVGTSLFHYTAGYKPFGNGTSNAQQIMKNTSVLSSTEIAYICYRLVASTTQESGNYENKLIYTATATF